MTVQTEKHSITLKDCASFLFLGCVWGASFLFMRVGVPELSAPVFGGLRVALAGLILLPILLRKTHWKVFQKNWLKLSVNGFLNPFLPFMLFAFALNELNAGVASVINASVPMITGLIAHVFLKDYLSKQQVVGLTIGIFGVVFLMYDGFSSGTQGSLGSFFLALTACLSYAVGSNFSKHYLQDVPPMTIASSGLVVSGLMALPFIFGFFPDTAAISWQAWASVLSIAVVSTAMAMTLFFQLIQRIGATRTTMVTLIIPLFGIFFGVVLLGEDVTFNMLMGSVVVLTGTALAIFAKR